MADSVGTFKTGNTTWTVRVVGRKFTATAPGFTDVWGDNWDAMENSAKVQASKAKIKVAVPYVTMERGHLGRGLRFTHRTATGIHAANGNVTYTDARGKTGQENRYTSDMRKPFSAEDETAYLALREQISELGRQADEIDERYKFDGGLKGEIDRAVSAEHAKRAGDGDD